MSEIHQLTYVSRSLMNGDLGAISALQEQCHEKNKPVGITGTLYFDNKTFFQLLEGDEIEVRRAFERIQNDPRHEDVYLKLEQKGPQRLFPGFLMKFINGILAPDLSEVFQYEQIRNSDPFEARVLAQRLVSA